MRAKMIGGAKYLLPEILGQTDRVGAKSPIFDLFLANVVRPSVCRLSSVTFVHPTQTIEMFGNVSTPFGTLVICDPSVKILRRSSQGNPSVRGLNQRGVEKCSEF